MSVRTKTPPTEAQCTFTFVGPVARAQAARTALQALGFVEAEPHAGRAVEAEASPALPWREALPPLSDAVRPGRMLRAARTKEALTQTQVATMTGIPQRHLSAMEQGKRAIGKERAKKLAKALRVDYRIFL
jgi:hypothetical protein